MHTGYKKNQSTCCFFIQLYKVLEQNEMLDNTIIIFASDNGGPPDGLDENWATNYPLRGAKTTVWEGILIVCDKSPFPGVVR